MKQPLQFTVSQQQKLADIASLRLTQYLVRLPDKEEEVSKKPKKVVKVNLQEELKKFDQPDKKDDSDLSS